MTFVELSEAEAEFLMELMIHANALSYKADRASAMPAARRLVVEEQVDTAQLWTALHTVLWNPDHCADCADAHRRAQSYKWQAATAAS
jgi:hypothetical protein